MDVAFGKAVAGAIIFVLNMVSSFLPMVLPSTSWISYAEALAGGVFFGASLMHLIPEAIHLFHDITEFPFAPIIALGSLLFLVIVEMFWASHSDLPDESERLLKTKSKRRSDPTSEPSPHDVMKANSLDSVTLVLYWVLMFHGLVEGIAFGGVKTESVFYAMFFAMIGHKPVETFALALRLWKVVHGFKYFLMMGIFSALVPTTIWALAALNTQSLMFFAVVSAASAGAFLFAGAHELGEMLHHGHKWPVKTKLTHITAFTIGILWMTVICLFAGEHEH